MSKEENHWETSDLLSVLYAIMMYANENITERGAGLYTFRHSFIILVEFHSFGVGFLSVNKNHNLRISIDGWKRCSVPTIFLLATNMRPAHFPVQEHNQIKETD